MINPALVPAMIAQFEHLLALCGAVLWGYPVGRAIRRRIIKRWARRG